MGDARTVAASSILAQVLYDLRDPNGNNYNKDGAYAELLGYLNRCNELIYEILVDENAELVCTGSGSLSTVAGTQSYLLSDNDMGDFWSPKKLHKERYATWISEYDPMKMCEENELYDAIIANQGSTTSRGMPDKFCLIGEYVWFNYVPDTAYTVNFRYFPNFVPLSATTDNMPYKNLFNSDITEGVKLFAKHRNERGIQVEGMLKDMFLARAMKIVQKRRKRSVSLSIRLR